MNIVEAWFRNRWDVLCKAMVLNILCGTIIWLYWELLKFVYTIGPICWKWTVCSSNDLKEYDLKECIQGGVQHTAAHLGGRFRCPRPSGPSYTPSERGSINMFEERGVECGPTQQCRRPRVFLVTKPTGNSSTVLCWRCMCWQMFGIKSGWNLLV